MTLQARAHRSLELGLLSPQFVEILQNPNQTGMRVLDNLACLKLSPPQNQFRFFLCVVS